jgi:hypothetical protein
MTKRRSIVAALATTGVLATAGVASGAAATLVDTGSYRSPTGGSINATCTGVAGVATNFNSVTYAVEANAVASHSKAGTAAVGTGVVCSVVNTSTGTVYGTIRGGAPGAAAPAAGTVTVPRTADVKACVSANAVYTDGSTAAFKNC